MMEEAEDASNLAKAGHIWCIGCMFLQYDRRCLHWLYVSPI
jgi:hypothetical protein